VHGSAKRPSMLPVSIRGASIDAAADAPDGTGTRSVQQVAGSQRFEAAALHPSFGSTVLDWCHGGSRMSRRMSRALQEGHKQQALDPSGSVTNHQNVPTYARRRKRQRRANVG